MHWLDALPVSPHIQHIMLFLIVQLTKALCALLAIIVGHALCCTCGVVAVFGRQVAAGAPGIQLHLQISHSKSSSICSCPNEIQAVLS
jgi:hypothetical protein